MAEISSHRPPIELDHDALIQRAATLSRYVQRLLAAEPELRGATDLSAPYSAQQMRAFLAAADITEQAQLQRALRMLRKRVMLNVIARDLGGLANLDEVMTSVSTLAEIALQTACTHLERLLTQDYGEPIASEDASGQMLHVVGMGKLGGKELNVSSDIDLVFVYPEDGETRGARALTNHEFFTRFARKLIAVLSELTADGYVFRVDMRLRPLGADGPLACSFEMLENYFVVQGREWERYAWSKARILCGDRGQELAELIRPFVFRRHLDYSAFDSLRDLHSQVRREVERREILDDIKLGRGGIREIEFIAQLFQLVRGGQDDALRATPTLTILPLLAQRNLLPADVVAALIEAYRFLRNLEHRLQYLDDKQTQTLPASAPDQALIATAMGYGEYDELRGALDQHRISVTNYFENIFGASHDESHPLASLWHAADGESNEAVLRALGYQQPQQLVARINALRSSPRVRQMPQASAMRMARLVPLVIETAAKLDNPDVTAARLLTLLESISRREAYLTLLLQFPATLERGARLASASPWAAEYLAQHPILLDELLDSHTLYASPDWKAANLRLARALDDATGDSERQMDTLRHFKHAHSLRLLAQDLSGELPLEKLSDHLSDLADLILEQTLRVTWLGLPQRHRESPRFAIIAYGKLGGKELGYASDLDLIFLHQDDASNGVENYSRLAQRINTWLTSLTSAGMLYDTDLRLRPDGVSGVLVSSIEGFANYQRAKAWVWEHQALARARFVAGDRGIGAAFEGIRVEVLRQRRDLDQLRSEVVAMREKMAAAHPNRSGYFDVKHDRGGLIDVEFVVQYLVLGYAWQYPELTGNIGNLALLKLAARLGLVATPLAQAGHDAYRRLRQVQHSLRLKGDKYARIEPEVLAAQIAAVKDLWSAVLKPL